MTTRIALVGAGSVARRHAAVLSDLPGVVVVSVADPVLSAAQALADTCGAHAFPDVEQALDAGTVDAAYVCVPPFAHGPAEDAVLDRQLPLFVEKPVALDLSTAERLAARVIETGVVTATGYHWRCLDLVQLAADRLAEAPALLANGYWLDSRPPVAWWGRLDRSGGQVVEQLTHVLDLARVLLGEPVEAYAAGVRETRPAAGGMVRTEPAEARSAAAPAESGAVDAGAVEDATAATVRFAGGAVATFAATSALARKHRAALHTVSRGLLLELSETSLVVDDGTTRHEHAPAEDPKVAVDADFVAAVRGERAGTRTPYAEAVRSHRFACAVAESAVSGRPVTLAVDAGVRADGSAA